MGKQKYDHIHITGKKEQKSNVATLVMSGALVLAIVLLVLFLT